MSEVTSTANTMTFVIEGQVNVSITITEVEGSLQFDLQVLDDTGEIGDLNALYFDLFDDSLTDGLSVTGDDVTDTNFKVDGVSKVDNYTNMNGEVLNELGKFDGGIQFGTAGIGTDDIRSTSFTISHETEALSLSDFGLQDFGLRLTSVGEEDGTRDDSLKLGGSAPEVPEGPVEPTELAINDTLTVQEDEGFEIDGGSDLLDTGANSILSNDLGDNDTPYTGDVATVNGIDIDPAFAQYFEGSDGGTLLVKADGTIDFSTTNFSGLSNDFADLDAGESRSTYFNYTLECGSEATLEVIVNGLEGGGGGIDGGGLDGGGIVGEGLDGGGLGDLDDSIFVIDSGDALLS